MLVMLDCQAAKHALENDVTSLGYKQIFARWQVI